MRFGKIQYLNLLVFDVFAKQYHTTSNFKAILNLKKNYPSKLNHKFLFGRIDAGFISSIAGMKSHFQKNTCKAGIIAYKEVWSVLVLPAKSSTDYQSATSNALCNVLGLQGQVLIGDRALQYYAKNHANNNFVDMAEAWYKKTQLPFVFGYMCFNSHKLFYQTMLQHFCKKLGYDKKYKGIKIPHYILMPYCTKLGITKAFAREYLKKIYHKINAKEQYALTRFYRHLRIKGIKPPKRF